MIDRAVKARYVARLRGRIQKQVLHSTLRHVLGDDAAAQPLFVGDDEIPGYRAEDRRLVVKELVQMRYLLKPETRKMKGQRFRIRRQEVLDDIPAVEFNPVELFCDTLAELHGDDPDAQRHARHVLDYEIACDGVAADANSTDHVYGWLLQRLDVRFIKYVIDHPQDYLFGVLERNPARCLWLASELKTKEMAVQFSMQPSGGWYSVRYVPFIGSKAFTRHTRVWKRERRIAYLMGKNLHELFVLTGVLTPKQSEELAEIEQKHAPFFEPVFGRAIFDGPDTWEALNSELLERAETALRDATKAIRLASTVREAVAHMGGWGEYRQRARAIIDEKLSEQEREGIDADDGRTAG